MQKACALRKQGKMGLAISRIFDYDLVNSFGAVG
jgi:hypothetical protein